MFNKITISLDSDLDHLLIELLKVEKSTIDNFIDNALINYIQSIVLPEIKMRNDNEYSRLKYLFDKTLPF